MTIPYGYPFYGQEIGILVFNGGSPRIPGDAGHAATFAYPVCYQLVNGSFMDLTDGSEAIRQELLRAAVRLKQQGVRGIVADCGLMSLYQKDIAAATGLPFVGASLCQLPMIWQMTGCQGVIGIITGHSGFLREAHLKGSGWNEDIHIAIEGMERQPHFSEIVIHGGRSLDPQKLMEETAAAALNLKRSNPDLTAIVLECSNLATYSRAVAQAVRLPVFDTISAANLLQYSISPPEYPY
ncbi:MAG: aspartate/glutamate racemase family protein [Eubacteriales bacterium]|nr:aspartate/glutamate racemase family protein [Eubacteriales bacterium]